MRLSGSVFGANQQGRRLSYETDAGKNFPDSNNYWVTGSYGADLEEQKVAPTVRMGHLITFHYRKASNAEFSDLGGSVLIAKQTTAAVNYRFGNAKLAFLAEYSRQKPSGSLTLIDDRTRKVLGLEYLLQKGLYLTLGVADDTGLPKNKRTLLTNLNWGFSEKSLIFPK